MESKKPGVIRIQVLILRDLEAYVNNQLVEVTAKELSILKLYNEA